MSKLKFKRRESKLENRIGFLTSCVLIIVFAVLIGVTTILTQNALGTTIDSQFKAMAKATGVQVQSVVDNVIYAAQNVNARIESGLKNLSYDSTKNESIVYDGVMLSESLSDIEKYVAEMIKNTVLTNDIIESGGVFFEPYAFSNELESYSFYISEENANEPIQSYTDYSTYSQNIYYKDVKESKKQMFTEPGVYNGVAKVTYSLPIMHNNKFIGVVTFDINASDFSTVVSNDSRYPSMYTTISNENRNIIYDTTDIDGTLVGVVLDEWTPDPKVLAKIQSGIDTKKEFTVEFPNFEQRRILRYYYPVTAGNQTWYVLTALWGSDRDAAMKQTVVILILTSIICLSVIIVFIVLMVKKELNPINGIVNAATEISKGNLNVELDLNTKYEIGRLAHAFHTTILTLNDIIGDIDYLLSQMAEGNFNIQSNIRNAYQGDFASLLISLKNIRNNLSNTIGRINIAANQVASGSEQVASAAQALSQGATEQASSIEELSATISEISSQIKINTVNANKAKEISLLSSSQVTNSNYKMQEMIDAMNIISSKSDEINKILQSIDDIAFQTNILALNAAVEAARAGVAGKGFAVVADEVRNLASKSAESAKNTAVLIEETISAVKNGANIAGETAAAMLGVIESTKSVASLVENIAESSNIQSESITQVTQSIEQISGVVQTNSATAQESAATSEELSGQAQILKDSVEKFVLLEDQ